MIIIGVLPLHQRPGEILHDVVASHGGTPALRGAEDEGASWPLQHPLVLDEQVTALQGGREPFVKGRRHERKLRVETCDLRKVPATRLATVARTEGSQPA
ncbi:hypothetical protein DLJ58_30825 [Micromonospora arida]|uniref:Uncharacterized protein n=1 Tax=Micromonospora arida TaxID=2203715 RepID=A0A3N9WPQ0_9ACTN|nr:hypothetical protein DLJ58_30825 [Micromonospora arida]